MLDKSFGMFIFGYVFVIGCVLLGYLAHHGKLIVLWQWTEFVIILGSALGAILISSPGYLIKNAIAAVKGAAKDKTPSKAMYMELLLCLFELTKLAKQNLLGLEPHVEEPQNSDIFKRYPTVLNNHHALDFICDTLKVQVSMPLPPMEFEELMDTDLEVVHAEEHKVFEMVNRTAEAMPGLGIVAAVLGVVITMGKMSQGKEVIGKSVAAALVGTFCGVLFCYGFVQPLAAKIQNNNDSEGAYMKCIKWALLAFAKDASPKICVEFARRSIPPDFRPSFQEMDEATASVGKAAAA